MVEISEKAKKQRAYAVVTLIFLAIGVGIFADANYKKEGVFSDEAKLLRKCKNSAKLQIARKPKIEDVYDGKIYASGLNAFGMRMPITFKCNNGYATQIDKFSF